MDKNEKIKKVEFKNQEVSKYDFIICPNCGAEEVGRFCPQCGQSNKNFDKPIKEIIGELFDSINLDIRLLNTLIPFFIKPGFLTQEYFKGKRNKYVPPMRMYMFFSILFFFLVQYIGSDEIKNNIINFKDDNKQEQVSLNLNKELSKDARHYQWGNLYIDTTEIKTDPDKSNHIDIEKIKQEVLNDTLTVNPVKETIIGGINALEKKELFFSKLLKNISYVLFILMPFFALILSLILWRSKMLYVKHLIFSINFHSFVFGLSSVIIVLCAILPDSISTYVLYLWWGMPLYLMLGIKRFYKRKLSRAFLKMLGALSLYSIVISIVIIAILALTAKEFYNI